MPGIAKGLAGTGGSCSATSTGDSGVPGGTVGETGRVRGGGGGRRFRRMGRHVDRNALETALRVLFLDHDLVKQTPFGTQHLGDGLPQQAVVVLFQPLVIEAAWQLDRQLDLIVFFGQADRLDRLKPGLEALPADVIPDDFQTGMPDRLRCSLHNGLCGVSVAG